EFRRGRFRSGRRVGRERVGASTGCHRGVVAKSHRHLHDVRAAGSFPRLRGNANHTLPPNSPTDQPYHVWYSSPVEELEGLGDTLRPSKSGGHGGPRRQCGGDAGTLWRAWPLRRGTVAPSCRPRLIQMPGISPRAIAASITGSPCSRKALNTFLT